MNYRTSHTTLSQVTINLFVVLSSFLVFTASGQVINLNTSLSFDNISVEQGLSHIGLTDIYQDSEGFIWVGTYDGLNRFDGEKFKIYKHVLDDSTSLLNNRVRCILEHGNNKIYVGTEEGLCVFNKHNEKFEKTGFPELDHQKLFITNLFEDSNQRLWVMTGDGRVFMLDTIKDSCITYNFGFIEGFRFSQSGDVREDQKGNFWVISGNQLIFLPADLDQNETRTFNWMFEDQKADIYKCRIDRFQNLWLGSSRGLFVYEMNLHAKNPELNEVNHLFPEQSIVNVFLDSKNNIWAAGQGYGLYHIQLKGNNNIYKIDQFSNSPGDTWSLSSNYIYGVFEDISGNIWVSTSEKGISLLKNRNFELHTIDRKDGLKEDYITSLVLYDSTTILCGTRKSGICLLDLKTLKVSDTWFKMDQKEESIISYLFKDSRGILWIGTGTRVYYLLPASSEVIDLTKQLSERNRYKETDAITEDDFGNIWVVGSIGLLRIQINDNNEIIDVLEFNDPDNNPELVFNIKVKTIYNDPADNCLWIGTWYNGLFKVEINSKQETVSDFHFQSFVHEPYNKNSLKSNFITAILRDSKNRLWITTEGGGVSQLIQDNDSTYFITYTAKDGLSNNVAKGIIESQNGILYIPTNVKLNLFLPEQNDFIHYAKGDGLPSEYFNNSTLALPDGRLAFSGNSGVLLITPDTKKSIPSFYEIHFGDMYIHGKKAGYGNAEQIDVLSKSLDYCSDIKLKHHQNAFSFELIALNWNFSNDIKISYRLKGYDKEWNTVKGRNYLAEYNKIPYGNYLFEFAVVSPENNEFKDYKCLDVSIAPPFWLTRWAIMLYVVFVISILFLIYYYLIQIQKLKNNIRIEKLEKEKEHEITETKLKFFTNITHEFRTPLTLISGPLESLITKFTSNDNVRHNLHIMKKQVNYLLLLFEQLLEFRKVENDKVKLKIQKINLTDFIWQIKMGFDHLAIKKNICFEFRNNISDIIIWGDPRKIEKIIYNILSNAFKYTPDNGTIIIWIDKNINSAIVKVEDSGPGIDPNELQLIFNRFYQSSKLNEQGVGIGLFLAKSLVEIHKGKIKAYNGEKNGAVFEIEFLLGKEHFLDSDFSANNSNNPSELYLSDESEDQEIKESLPKQNLPVMFIVDDVAEMRDFIEQLFIEDFSTYKFENGKAALDKVLMLNPDIIICDVCMPVMNGLELCEKLKADQSTSHIPFLILTSKNELEYNLSGYKHGADDYISKPFSNELLRVRVANVLRNKQALKIRYDDKFVNENLSDKADWKDKEFLFTIVQILQDNIANSEFDNTLFSDKVKLSKTRLYSEIKRITGKTPNALIREYRFKKAVNLLEKGENSISEIINLCGFESRAYFYKCFKDKFNMTPSEFRSQQSVYQ